MFVSALGSITGRDNRLALRRVDRASVLLVDGLGTLNLKAAGGHAPFLNSLLKTNPSIACGFPATTATSITSFATGLSAGEHGIVGYQVYDREHTRQANLLSGWNETQVPEQWQPHPTVAERAGADQLPCYVIGPAEYEGSGFTRITMRGATYLPARTIADRFERLAQLHRAGGAFLSYCYVPELDQIAHAKGVNSDAWLALVEELDGQVRSFSGKLTRSDGFLLTADHGVIDVKPDRHFVLDELIDWPKDAIFSGDPRVGFVYQQGDSQPLRELLTEVLQGVALVLSRDEVIAAGWYGSVVTEQTKLRLPELFILATANIALYHRGFSKPASFRMVGHHGGLSIEELQVPLLRLGGYAC